MKDNKNNSAFNIIIIILIIIVMGLMNFIIYKELFTEKSINNYNTTSTSKQISLKIDNKKDWIYDANYELNVKQESYSTYYKTYDINDYKAPYININSVYAKTINNEIKNLYNEAIKVFNEGIEDKTSYIDTFEYNYYLNENILSLVITTGYGATDTVYPNYYIYNIDIENGNKIIFEDIINYKNLSNSNFDNKAQKAILNEYDNFYKDISKDDSLYTEYYESYKQDTINDYKNNTNKKCYIDNNGDIYLFINNNILSSW